MVDRGGHVTAHRRELRTCPVEGFMVLLNSAIQSLPAPGTEPPAAVPAERGWRPHAPPWVGIEGETRVVRDPAVRRDGLGAHEVLHGTLGVALLLAAARMEDLRRDTRLRGFHVAARFVDGACAGTELIALPVDRVPSAPARWRDAEIGGPRCLEVEEEAVALLAWAPRSPLETWVLPRRGTHVFGRWDVPPVAALAEHVLGRLARALPGVNIDVVLVDGEPWRLELRPRLVSDGLFVSATGVPAHGSFPEEATAFLQDFFP